MNSGWLRGCWDRVAEGAEDQDAMQYLITGQLSLIIGAFLLLCTLIPNPMHGWMAFLVIGGGMFLFGFWMRSIGKRKQRESLQSDKKSTQTHEQ